MTGSKIDNSSHIYSWDGDFEKMAERREEIRKLDPLSVPEHVLQEMCALLAALRKTAGPPRTKKSSSPSPGKGRKIDFSDLDLDL